MEDNFQKSIFDRSLLTAVFVGIFATLITMGYDFIFVEVFKFPLSSIINVATLIFSVNIVFLAVGFIYYAFLSMFKKKGTIFFIAFFVLLTLFLVWKTGSIDRTDDAFINKQFRDLLSGIILIIGILASLAVPFLSHNRKFEKYVL